MLLAFIAKRTRTAAEATPSTARDVRAWGGRQRRHLHHSDPERRRERGRVVGSAPLHGHRNSGLGRGCDLCTFAGADRSADGPAEPGPERSANSAAELDAVDAADSRADARANAAAVRSGLVRAHQRACSSADADAATELDPDFHREPERVDARADSGAADESLKHGTVLNADGRADGRANGLCEWSVRVADAFADDF